MRNRHGDADAGIVVGLDADDTLWHNENAFAETEQRFRELVEPWADGEAADRALEVRQREQVGVYGYGAKAFALTMIHTACELSLGRIAAAELAKIVGWADELLTAPTILIDGALDAVQALHEHHELYILTKGDLHRQLQRVDESGLATWCVDVEVMAHKDAETYRRILARHQIDPARFVMIGNSLVSDVYPVLKAGGRAIHIPYAITWALEEATSVPEPKGNWRSAANLAEAVTLIDQLPWN